MLLRIEICILLVCAFASHCVAADRVALLIGNSTYEHATKLPNALNDATAIESRLKNAGFKTILSKDGGIDKLTATLEQFYAAAKSAEIALVFYAGHGIEHDKLNYLLPTDAKLMVEAGLEGDGLLAAKRALLKRETLPIDSLMTDLSRTGARLKVIVLDCCRDDPKLASRSWATRGANAGTLANMKEDSIPEGTMLVFSTAPGTAASDGTGANSPFTNAVIQSLQPGYSIVRVFTEAALVMKGQEPYIRFDGQGKAMAAFGTSPLVPGTGNSPAPGKAADPAPQRQFMVVKVDGKERQLPLIPADELAKLRATIPEIKEVNRAFRLDLTSQDIGKKIAGIAFEARNRTGIDTAIYQAEPCYVSMGRTNSSTTEWRKATIVSEMFEMQNAFFTPAKSGGEAGYQFGQSQKYFHLLPPGNFVPITQMTTTGWIMMSALGKSEKVSSPAYFVISTALLAPGRHDTPITDAEAVLAFCSL